MVFRAKTQAKIFTIELDPRDLQRHLLPLRGIPGQAEKQQAGPHDPNIGDDKPAGASGADLLPDLVPGVRSARHLEGAVWTRYINLYLIN